MFIKKRQIHILLFLIFLFASSINAKNKRTNEWSGNIYEDTTFYKSKSPYIILGDLIVHKGSTLYIEPGVKVLFYNFDVLNSGYKLNLAELHIEGRIIASGTSTDPITFSLIEDNPPDIWGGVYIKTSRKLNLFKHCKFDTGYGIYADKSKVNIENCDFQKLKDYAVKTQDSTVVVKESFIGNIAGDGILLYNSDASIKRNFIVRNTGNGINNKLSNAFIYRNVVGQNELNGVIIDKNSNSKIVSNIILYNDSSGIVMIDSGCNVYNNIIYRNLASGIFTNSDLVDIQLHNNDFYKNGIDKNGIFNERSNISVNPNFRLLDTKLVERSNFNLKTNSLCIKKGFPYNDIGLFPNTSYVGVKKIKFNITVPTRDRIFEKTEARIFATDPIYDNNSKVEEANFYWEITKKPEKSNPRIIGEEKEVKFITDKFGNYEIKVKVVDKNVDLYSFKTKEIIVYKKEPNFIKGKIPKNIHNDALMIKKNGPFIMESSVKIHENALLVIEKGCEIIVQSRKNSKLKFDVWGQLVVKGDKKERVVFRSDAVFPIEEDWNGIYINSGKKENKTVINYLEIRNAANGISISNSDIKIKNLLFEKCKNSLNIFNQKKGEITNLIFKNCVNGLNIKKSKLNFFSAIFYNISDYPVQIINSDVFISDNLYFENRLYSVHVKKQSKAKIYNSVFIRGRVGIFCDSTSYLKLRRNIFLSQRDFGIFFGISFREHDIKHNNFFSIGKNRIANYKEAENSLDYEPKFMKPDFINPLEANWILKKDSYLKTLGYGIIYKPGFED